ncbi:MAG: hypothetical protein ABL952_16420, partial [Pyrinomonadaceae bacterium]
LEELAQLGYSVVLYPVTLLRVAMKATEAALAVIPDENALIVFSPSNLFRILVISALHRECARLASRESVNS